MARRDQSGYTFVEALLALIFTGLIAGLTIPGLIYVTRNNTGQARAKELAGEIQRAAINYHNENPDIAPTALTDVQAMTNGMKYVSTVSDANFSVDLQACNGRPVCCEGQRPCYRFGDGGVVLYQDHISAGNPSFDYYCFLI